jgi:hypothetical protein
VTRPRHFFRFDSYFYIITLSYSSSFHLLSTLISTLFPPISSHPILLNSSSCRSFPALTPHQNLTPSHFPTFAISPHPFQTPEPFPFTSSFHLRTIPIQTTIPSSFPHFPPILPNLFTDLTPQPHPITISPQNPHPFPTFPDPQPFPSCGRLRLIADQIRSDLQIVGTRWDFRRLSYAEIGPL